jgi:hypothetical protein
MKRAFDFELSKYLKMLFRVASAGLMDTRLDNGNRDAKFIGTMSILEGRHWKEYFFQLVDTTMLYFNTSRVSTHSHCHIYYHNHHCHQIEYIGPRASGHHSVEVCYVDYRRKRATSRRVHLHHHYCTQTVKLISFHYHYHRHHHYTQYDRVLTLLCFDVLDTC